MSFFFFFLRRDAVAVGLRGGRAECYSSSLRYCSAPSLLAPLARSRVFASRERARARRETRKRVEGACRGRKWSCILRRSICTVMLWQCCSTTTIVPFSLYWVMYIFAWSFSKWKLLTRALRPGMTTSTALAAFEKRCGRASPGFSTQDTLRHSCLLSKAECSITEKAATNKHSESSWPNHHVWRIAPANAASER